MTIPTDGYPYWATDDLVDPVSSTPNKQQPSAAKQQYGQAYGQNTTRQDINWMLNNIREWIQAFDEQSEVDSIHLTADLTKTPAEVADQFGGTWNDEGDQVLAGTTVQVFKRTA